MKAKKDIFKKGSITYYFSSLFFPKDIKDKVTILYAFVRTADDYVDSIPQNKKAFYQFWDVYRDSSNGKEVDNSIISSFTKLEKACVFDPKWTESFLKSMEKDLTQSTYKDINELEEYIYGSADVIGLYMAKIMKLPSESFDSAMKMGKAMQYLNFIRDIAEDNLLGRTYIPQDILKKYKLKNLLSSETMRKPEHFITLINQEIERYLSWDKEARKGFRYIPKRYLIPIKTAADMYRWTALQIKKDPFIVYKRKVKPKPKQVIIEAVKNTLLVNYY